MQRVSYRIVLEADTLDELNTLIERVSKPPKPNTVFGKPVRSRQHYTHPRKYTAKQVLSAMREAQTVGVYKAAEAAGMTATTLYQVRSGRSYRELWPEVQKILAAKEAR